jgi:hypothetical protein
MMMMMVVVVVVMVMKTMMTRPWAGKQTLPVKYAYCVQSYMYLSTE